MKKEGTLKIIVYSLLILLIVAFIIKICPMWLQNDVLYDIKLGERYLTSGMFKIDDYSFHVGLVYQSHHYLVCLLDYVIYYLFSFGGLYYLEIMLTMIIALLFYKLNKTMIKDKFLIYILVFFQLMVLTPFISLRAQMYSYIIFLIEILIIEQYLNTSKKGYALLLSLLPLLLINLHSGVIYFYFIIIGVYMINYKRFNFKRLISDERMTKYHFKILLLSLIIGVCLTFINPYGFDGLVYGLKTINSYYIKNFITEFKAPDLSPLGLMIYSSMITGILFLLFSKRKILIHQLFLFIGTLFMALMALRHFSLLVIVMVVILPHIEDVYKQIDKSNWDIIKSFKKGFTPMNIILVIFYIMMFFFFLYGIFTKDKDYLPEDKYPIGATIYIKDHLPSNVRIFNKYEWGSYLMFNDIKVFIDSRCDLYNEEYNKEVTIFKDYNEMMNNTQSPADIVLKYDIDYFLLNKKDKLVERLLEDWGYVQIYSDSTAILIKVIK